MRLMDGIPAEGFRILWFAQNGTAGRVLQGIPAHNTIPLSITESSRLHWMPYPTIHCERWPGSRRGRAAAAPLRNQCASVYFMAEGKLFSINIT